MNKAEFNLQVDALVERVDSIAYDDYYGAMSVVRDFQDFAHAHIQYLNQYTTEHVYSIKGDFKSMKKYKSGTRKTQAYNSGIRGLRSDVASMKSNKVPE